jgi:hypothetical protein
VAAAPAEEAAPVAAAPASAVVAGMTTLPNAKPGECYGRVTMPAQYRSEMISTETRAAYERVDVMPAEYETVVERVLEREASNDLRIVAAEYEEVEEQVMIRPASRREESIPAIYDTFVEQRLVRPAYTTWKAGTGPVTKIDEVTGEVLCLVEVPAEYESVTKQVLRQAASVRYVDIPAEYGTVRRQVIKTPERTENVEIPAEYSERTYQRLVRPAMEVRTMVPAEMSDVETKVLVEPAREEWRQIMCESNMTEARIIQLQDTLAARGFDPGPDRGSLNEQTMLAVRSFQEANGLPVDGFINISTAQVLGISD